MINVGICDDSIKDANLIYDLVSKTLFEEEEARIYRYQSGQELIASIEGKTFNCNLIYLAICMNGLNGLEVADYIRKNKIDVDIIFVTKTSDYVYKGYMYKAYSYILKKGMKEDIPQETLRYIREIRDSEECINVTSSGIKRKVPISQIMYVESDKRRLILHTKTEAIPFYAKMSELESVFLDRGFIRTHQSYMVKAKYVTNTKVDEICLGDITLPISRKYSKQVVDYFQ